MVGFLFLRRSKKSTQELGVQHGTEVGFALLTQLPQVQFSAFPIFFSDELFLMLLRLIDSTSQIVEKLENVDQTI